MATVAEPLVDNSLPERPSTSIAGAIGRWICVFMPAWIMVILLVSLAPCVPVRASAAPTGTRAPLSPVLPQAQKERRVARVRRPYSPGPTASLSASPQNIFTDEHSILTWSSSNVSQVTLDSQPVSGSGSLSVSPQATTTYHLVVTGPSGTRDVITTVSVIPLTSKQYLEEYTAAGAQGIYFDPGSDAIRPDADVDLSQLAQTMLAHQGWRLQIEGNCDPTEGTTEEALALGERRADAAYQRLAIDGVAVSAMKTISYGKEKPICTGTSFDCLAQDRRDRFTLISP